MKNIKKGMLVLVAVLILSLCGCETDATGDTQNTQPPYIGVWHVMELQTNPVVVEINNSGVRMEMSVDGTTHTMQASSYTVSQDNLYTYVEADFDGYTMVFVVVNQDMLCVFNATEFDSDITAVTGNGTRFGAEVCPYDGVVLMRVGSSDPNWPLAVDANSLGIGGPYTLYTYYPNSGILHLFGGITGNNVGYDVVYIKDQYSVVYIEELALANAFGLPYDSISTSHGFVITDNK